MKLSKTSFSPLLLFFIVFTLFFLPFVSSSFGYNSLQGGGGGGGGGNVTYNNNYTVFNGTMGVNLTQMENITVINIKESWLNNFVNSLVNLKFLQDILNATGIYNSGGNASWNQSYANTLYYNISNPNNYVNGTYPLNTTAAIQQLINSTGIYTSGGNSSWNQSYAETLFTNKTYVDYVNSTTTSWITNTFLKIVDFFTKKGDGDYLYNDSNTIYFNETKLNDTIASLASGGNASFNQSLTDTLYVHNTTEAIQNLINSTGLYSAKNPFNQSLNTTDSVQFAGINGTSTGADKFIFNGDNVHILRLNQLSALTGNHLSFTTPETGTGLTQGLDIGIEASDGKIAQIKQNENSSIEFYTNRIHRMEILADGNINMSNNLTVNGNYLCNTTVCFSFKDLNTSGSGGNDSWNESYARTLFALNSTFGIQALYNSTALQIAQIVNITAQQGLTINTTSNIQNLINGTGIYSFNNTLNIQNLYNSTALLYAQMINSTANIQNLINGTGIYSFNTTLNIQNLANSSYVFIGSQNKTLVSCHNVTGNATDLCTITGTNNFTTANVQAYGFYPTSVVYNKTEVDNNLSLYAPNTTFAIQQLYNATALVYAQMINSTLNIQNLINSTGIYSFNTTLNIQNLANASYVFRGSQNQTLVSCKNLTGNSTDLCTITSSGTNNFTTANVQAFGFYPTSVVYNKTEVDNNLSLYAPNTTFAIQQLINSTGVYSFNSTLNIQNLANSSYVFRGSQNQTLVSCRNITGNTSDLCSVTTGGVTNNTAGWILNFTNIFSSNWGNVTGLSTFNTSAGQLDALINTTLNIQQLYNATALVYAQMINSTANIQNLINGTGIYSFNTTLNIQNLANASYVFRGSQNQTLVSCRNITGNSTDLCTITGGTGITNNTAGWTLNFSDIHSDSWGNVTGLSTFNTSASQLDALINSTFNIQNLYNATALLYAQMINSTVNIQNLVNASYVFRGSQNQTLVSCRNITGNSTDLCTITGGAGVTNNTAGWTLNLTTIFSSNWGNVTGLSTFNTSSSQLDALINTSTNINFIMNNSLGLTLNLSKLFLTDISNITGNPIFNTSCTTIAGLVNTSRTWNYSAGNNWLSYTASNVSIGGTSSPNYRFEIVASATALNVSGGMYVNTSSVGIKSITPAAELEVNGKSNLSGNVSVGGSLIIGNGTGLLFMPVITLPTCATATNGSIGRNLTGLYFCLPNATWVKATKV